MLRQEAIKRVFTQIVENNFSPILLDSNFKYSKTNNNFTKSVNSFDIVITPTTSFPTITYNENSEQLFLHLRINTSIKCLKFEKWHELNFLRKAHLHKDIETVNCHIEIDFNTFNDSDFYTPTPSQQFKNSVRVSLADNQNIEFSEEIHIFLNYHLSVLLKKTQNLCTDVDFFNDKKDSLELTFANLLIFFKDFERAEIAYKEAYQNMIDSLSKIRLEHPWQDAFYILNIKSLSSDAKKFLNLDFEVPDYLPVKLSFGNRELNLPETNIKYKEIFSTVKHSKSISSFCISKTGRVIIGHQSWGFNNTQQFVTIWDNNGKLLLEFELSNEENTNSGSVNVGYLENCDMFFANCYLIDNNLEYFRLELPVKSSKNCKAIPHFQIPLVFDEKAELFIAYHHYKTDEECYVVFYNKSYKLVKKLLVTLRPTDIIVEKQWILLHKYMSYISIIDYDGNEISRLESNNINDNSCTHDISKSTNYLFSFFYYVKSYLFDLTNFKKDALWGHTTFEKDYKEIYYNDTHSNFGVCSAKFSPNENYIVAGAEHGKYVAWTLPDKKRIELIPNEEYLKTMPDAEIYSIGDKKYLKNRGNNVREIIFWENGKYFSLIIQHDLLIWNDSFEHISTIFNFGKSDPGKTLNFNDTYLGIYKKFGHTEGDELIVFKKTSA